MMGANNRCPAQHVPLVGGLSKKKKRDRALHSFVGETEGFIGSSICAPLADLSSTRTSNQGRQMDPLVGRCSPTVT